MAAVITAHTHNILWTIPERRELTAGDIYPIRESGMSLQGLADSENGHYSNRVKGHTCPSFGTRVRDAENSFTGVGNSTFPIERGVMGESVFYVKHAPS